MNRFEEELVAASMRLGSLARRRSSDETWLSVELQRDGDRLSRLAEGAALLRHRLGGQGEKQSGYAFPIDFACCDGVLADCLDRGFLRSLLVISSANSFGASRQWMDDALPLLREAARCFRDRHRHRLASETLKVAAASARRVGLTRAADELSVEAEDIATECVTGPERWSRFAAKVIARYGFDPLRVFLVGIVVMMFVTVLMFLIGGIPFEHAVSLAIGDYITLGGAPEYASLGTFARLGIAIEAFLAIILNGFFITLLARRLFQA